MDKTLKINLGGTLFLIDEESYRMLRDYLQAIDNRFRNVPGGYETTEDIESRIAEIFLSQQGLTGVIAKENVESMITILGKPEEFAQFDDEIGQSSYSPREKRMYRNHDDRIIGGVCGGIGAYVNNDPVWIRLFFILFTLFFGVGILIYVVLWIALPVAESDRQKQEMYGSADNSSMQHNRYPGSSGTGSAFNEIFKAFGKGVFIVVRVILILLGISFVLTGFLTIVTYIMVFFFKFPGSFSTEIDGVNLSYIPDFLSYIVSPAVAPWITILTSLIIILPMLALIYWGVKMIFWFKAKDGIFSFVALIVWFMSLAALSIIFFSQGISYTETARSVSFETLIGTPDTLYLRIGKEVADLNYDHAISIPDENYEILIAEENRKVFVRTYLHIETSADDNIKIEVRKRSTGRSRPHALERAESLLYDFRQNGDTLYLDEYFSYPAETKWGFDNIGVSLAIPEGTIVNLDHNAENLIRPRIRHYYDMDNSRSDYDTRLWKFTDDRFRPIDQN